MNNTESNTKLTILYALRNLKQASADNAEYRALAEELWQMI